MSPTRSKEVQKEVKEPLVVQCCNFMSVCNHNINWAFFFRASICQKCNWYRIGSKILVSPFTAASWMVIPGVFLVIGLLLLCPHPTLTLLWWPRPPSVTPPVYHQCETSSLCQVSLCSAMWSRILLLNQCFIYLFLISFCHTFYRNILHMDFSPWTRIMLWFLTDQCVALRWPVGTEDVTPLMVNMSTTHQYVCISL